MTSEFDHLPWSAPVAYPALLTFPNGVISTHEHLRDELALGDGRSELYVPLATAAYRHLVAIGNTKVPIVTPDQALRKKKIWQDLRAPESSCLIHVAGLVNELTTPALFLSGYDRRPGEEAWTCLKMFLRAASNAHGADVDDVTRVLPLIRTMSKSWSPGRLKPILKIHCERKFTTLGRRIAIESRERAAVERDVELILREVPEAVIEICHVSDGDTIEAIRYYRQRGYHVHGEISPHYAWTCLDDLYENGSGGTGFNNHAFCLPVFKSRRDMGLIEAAMLSGEFHYGPDAACWADDPTQESGVKLPRSGVTVGGQTQLPDATISRVIERFVETATSLEKLGAYLHDNAARLYGFPPSGIPTSFKYEEWTVPSVLENEHLCCTVAMGGQVRRYRHVDPTESRVFSTVYTAG